MNCSSGIAFRSSPLRKRTATAFAGLFLVAGDEDVRESFASLRPGSWRSSGRCACRLGRAFPRRAIAPPRNSHTLHGGRQSARSWLGRAASQTGNAPAYCSTRMAKKRSIEPSGARCKTTGCFAAPSVSIYSRLKRCGSWKSTWIVVHWPLATEPRLLDHDVEGRP